MGKFEQGNNGRPKGAKNKRTEQWEAFTNYCLEGGLQRFEQELNALEGKDYVNAFMGLLEFHKPKLARAEVKHEGNTTTTIKIIRGDTD